MSVLTILGKKKSFPLPIGLDISYVSFLQNIILFSRKIRKQYFKMLSAKISIQHIKSQKKKKKKKGKKMQEGK